MTRVPYINNKNSNFLSKFISSSIKIIERRECDINEFLDISSDKKGIQNWNKFIFGAFSVHIPDIFPKVRISPHCKDL